MLIHAMMGRCLVKILLLTCLVPSPTLSAEPADGQSHGQGRLDAPGKGAILDESPKNLPI